MPRSVTLLLSLGRYYNRHCGSRSAAQMGGGMRGFGSHLGATAAPGSSPSRWAGGWGGGGPRFQKKKCETEIQETARGEGRTGRRH